MLKQKRFLMLVAIGITAVVVALLSAHLAVAQEQSSCPSGVGCPRITLSPATLVGDFYLNDVLLAAGQNSPILQVPPGQDHAILIRSMVDSAAGFGQLFVYEETTLRVNVQDGQLRQYQATPHKVFVRGTLNFTCRIANINAAEDARCQVMVDGGVLGEVQPGQQASFVLDPGQRALSVQLVGTNADLWLPDSWNASLNIRAGQATKAASQFSKRAKLTLVMNVTGAVGDFYIADQLIAAQVASVEQFLPAGNYQIALRNISDPASAGLYHWSDVTSSTTLRAGQERTLELRPKTNMTLAGIVQTADPNLCVGSTSAQIAAQSWNASLVQTAACLHNVLVWETEADQQQARRQGSGLCQILPQPAELAAYYADYWALADVGVVYFNMGQRLREAGKDALAKEAFQVILRQYACAAVWDPRGWFWSLKTGAEEQSGSLP